MCLRPCPSLPRYFHACFIITDTSSASWSNNVPAKMINNKQNKNSMHFINGDNNGLQQPDLLSVLNRIPHEQLIMSRSQWTNGKRKKTKVTAPLCSTSTCAWTFLRSCHFLLIDSCTWHGSWLLYGIFHLHKVQKI